MVASLHCDNGGVDAGMAEDFERALDGSGDRTVVRDAPPQELNADSGSGQLMLGDLPAKARDRQHEPHDSYHESHDVHAPIVSHASDNPVRAPYDHHVPSSTHTWLPDRHLGVAATLAHADELIGQVGDVLFPYQTQPGGIIRLGEVSDGLVSRTVVTGVASIPRKVPLLVADALVALRNALEHVLFAEVEYLDGVLDEKASRLVEMPAAKTYDDFQKWVKGRARNGPTSLRAGSPLVRRIEALQPLQRTRDPQDHPLAVLVSHTNHAKHRTPLITAVRLAGMYREDQRPRSAREMPRRPETPLKVGEVIAETPVGTQIPVTLFPTIGINRPGTDRWPVLIAELEQLATWVRTQAVPRLITGTDPPTPSLPTRYDITSGHDDERSALSAGSTTSAATNHQQRLGAAAVRVDIAETIGQMEGAPGPEQIAAWLDSLPDEEMLARMSQIEVTHTYEPDIVLRNFGLLEKMRDDAIRFGSADPETERLTWVNAAAAVGDYPSRR